MATPTYELIETTTLASSASSVSFSSITQDYRDLVLMTFNISSNAGIRIEAVLNNDTGANYSRVYALGNGSTTSSAAQTANWVLAGLTGDSTTPATNICQIMDYSATDKHKSCLIRYNHATIATAMEAARWANTSAITEIDLSPAAGTFEAGTIFSLYGIASEVV